MGRRAVLVLANPKSGGGLAGQLVPHLVRALRERELDTQVFESKGPGEIGEAVARWKDEGWHCLCVVGGDGTVREALQGGTGPEHAMTTLPAGTANVLALEFGLPKEPDACAAMIDKGKTRLIDLGVFASGPSTGTERRREERFALFVGAGFDARIVEVVDRKRAGGTLGKLKYVPTTLGQLLKYDPGEHYIVLEDGERHGPYAQVIVSNVATYGGVWKLPGPLEHDDGLFECYGLVAENRRSMIAHGLRGVFGRMDRSKSLEQFQASSCRIESEGPGPLQVDGDPGGMSPAEIRVEPKALRLIVP